MSVDDWMDFGLRTKADTRVMFTRFAEIFGGRCLVGARVSCTHSGTALTTSAEATSALQAFHGALCKMEELMGADWRAGLPIYVEGGAITVV